MFRHSNFISAETASVAEAVRGDSFDTDTDKDLFESHKIAFGIR